MKPHLQCSYCHQVFDNKYRWTRHENTHTKPFKCKFCGKAFAEKSKATQHEQIWHVELKPVPIVERGKTKEGFKVKITSRHHCMTCKKIFPSAEILKTHVRTVHPKVTWKCVCGLKMEPAKLIKHRLSCYLGIKKKGKAKKDSRKKTTDTGKSKSKSKKSHSQKKAFSTLSGHKYATKPLKKESRQKESKHKATTTSHKGPKRCPECSVVIQDSSFAYHQKFHILCRINKKYLINSSTGNFFLCRYKTCYWAFDSLGELTKHEETHTGPKPYMCSACDHQCKTSAKLNAHYAKCKDRLLLKHPCGHCGKFFGRTSILWRHYESHRPDKKEWYSCGHCKSKFSSRLNLNKHHSSNHQTRQPKTKTSGIIFSCNFCPEKFKTQQDLMDHVQHCHLSMIASTSKAGRTLTANHAEKKQVEDIKKQPYKCSYCSQGFSTSKMKSRHERIHTNEKPHVCYNCGQAFTFKYVLKHHQQNECKVIGDDPDAVSLDNILGDYTKDDDDDIISISSESSGSSESSESEDPSPPPSPNQTPPIQTPPAQATPIRATPIRPMSIQATPTQTPVINSMQQLAPVAIIKYPDNNSQMQLGSATSPGPFAPFSCLPTVTNQLYVFRDQPLRVMMLPAQNMTGGLSLHPSTTGSHDVLMPKELPPKQLATAEKINQQLAGTVPPPQQMDSLSLEPPDQDILMPLEVPSEQLDTAERILPVDVQNVSDFDNAIPMKLQRLT